MKIKIMTLNQIKKQAKEFDLTYEETLEMAYENLANVLKFAFKRINKAKKCLEVYP